MKFILGFRVFTQQIPCPGKREGSSFVPGEKKCHDFISQLAIRHAAAIFVSRRH